MVPNIFINTKTFSRTKLVAIGLSTLGIVGTASLITPLVNRLVDKVTSGCLTEPIEICIPQKTMPSVVTVKTESGSGSGVIVSQDGKIVTNAHVLPGVRTLEIHLSDDRVLEADVIGYHQSDTDLALVQIKNPPEDLTPIKISSSKDLKIGQHVFAIGSPLGLPHTVSQGAVSQLNSVDGYVQLDIAINPGNSGGATIDTNGRLVGINTAIVSSQQGNTGIGLAIPSDEVIAFLNAFEQGDIPEPPSIAPELIEPNGEPIQNKLAFEQSQQLDDGSFFIPYQFIGKAGQSVEIIMSATGDGNVDPYLILHSPSGEKTEGDDIPGGLNALLSGTLPESGVYTLWANTAEAGQMGDYSLVFKAL